MKKKFEKLVSWFLTVMLIVSVIMSHNVIDVQAASYTIASEYDGVSY